MNSTEFSTKMNDLIPGCSEQNINLWAVWAEECTVAAWAEKCTATGQYVDFEEQSKETAVSELLDSFYASFYFIKSEFGEETAKQIIDLADSQLCLYPYEMKSVAKMLHEGCAKEQLLKSMEDGSLVLDEQYPTMKDVEQDLSRKKSQKEDKAINEDNKQDSQIMENEAVQEFFKLLMGNQPEAGHDYSIMLWQMESMAYQLNMAMKELAEVKGQLAEMQESPVKKFVSHTVNTVEKRLHSIQEGLMDMKGRIIQGAKQAVANVKQTGIKALDKAVSAIGIKKGLEAMQKDVSASMADVKNTIQKIEAVGQELRSAGEHLKNVGRAASGKERKVVDGGTEGRFQSAILSPLRAERDILIKLNNLTLAAIGNVERLEQAAKLTPHQEKAMEQIISHEDDVLMEHQAGAGIIPETNVKAEKNSVLKDLKEKKDQATTHSAPVPDKERKKQEATL